MTMPARAQSADSTNAEDPSPHSDAGLVSEVVSVQPEEPFTVALRMTMEEGWHSYWMNPGDSGQPTSIDWALPSGFTADSIQWPYPHRIVAGPLTSYGYSDELFLLSTITPPPDLEPGTRVRLEGKAMWLICADLCLPAEADLRLTLPVRAEPPALDEQWLDAFAETRSKLPAKLPAWSFEAARSAGSYALRVTPPEGWVVDLEGAYFFPSEKAVLDHAAPQPFSAEDDGSYLIALQQSDYAQEPAARLRGTLVAPKGGGWGPGGAVQALWVDAPVDTLQAVGALPITATPGGSITFAWALLFAFAGGMILNLMPCVFPVLSIKVLSFARQAGKTGAAPRKHGLVFGAGVVMSFWVLAGLLLALRAGGSQIGWGFQLQSPFFVALMAMLFFGIGLNLLGVFEIGYKLTHWGGQVGGASAGNSFSGSFLSGVLATIVATPCTAPFMGAALGVALSLSAMHALLVFTALGVGMATPYVLLSVVPRLLERLPGPGAWMETLRQGLAFPMFATAIWLVWVFGQQAGVGGVALLLAALLLLGVSAWILGQWDAYRISTGWRLFTRGLAAAAFAGAVVVALIGARLEAPAAGPSAAPADGIAWQPFSPERVAQLRAEGRPVFVDFTAAWCLTCQVNERTALSAAAVREAFSEKNVAMLKADWTNRDDTITRALKSHGRSGVPLYVLYKGGDAPPTLLPEILTQDIVLDALEDLPGGDDEAPPDVADRPFLSSSLTP